MKALEKINSLLVKGVLSLAVVFLLFTTSCQQNGNENELIDFSSPESDAIAEADFDEVDDISSNIMSYADGNIGGKTSGNNEDDRLHCAVVTHDQEAQTITIDFGDGCTGPNGVVRSGIIFITYTGKRFIPGSKWTIELRNFYINNRHIEGTRTIENVSETINDNPKFHIVLTDGKITWPDETFATREVDRYRVWVRAANPLNDEVHILERSVASGLNRRGVKYTATVLADLIFKRICRANNTARIPVQGIKELVVGDKTFLVDFGDGRCDSIVTITSNGVTREVDLANSN